MIKLEHVVLPSAEQMDFVIEGMRNPMNSWDKSDSFECPDGICRMGDCPYYEVNECGLNLCTRVPGDFILGKNDNDLMVRLAKAGTEHRKYLRMMPVYVRVTAPLYWFKEMDTFKVGTVSNSCSTMHKIHAKPFELDDFSYDHLLDMDDCEKYDICPLAVLECTIAGLNYWRDRYLVACITEEETGLPAKDIWWQMIQLLPSSYNQTRNLMLNYEVLGNIYHQRKNHKLDEWREFCKWIESLPYSYLITGENA